MESIYIRRRYTHGGDIYTEGKYTRRGHTHRGGNCREVTYIGRGHIQGRNIHKRAT